MYVVFATIATFRPVLREFRPGNTPTHHAASGSEFAHPPCSQDGRCGLRFHHHVEVAASGVALFR